MPDLFDPPPYVRDNVASYAAAGRIEPAAASLRRVVLDAIREAGAAGLTDEQGIDTTAMSASTYRPRRVELVKAGMVRDSGRTRAVRSGCRAIVWVIGFDEKPAALGDG